MDPKMENNVKGEKSMELLKIAQENFSLWRESLLTKDPKKVAELYAEDATFLATVSGKFRHGIKDAEEYFVHFLEKNPEGKIVDEKVQEMGENYYAHSGLYNFNLDDGEGGRKTVEARFTFNWRKESDGKWKIIHHHSSVNPEA